MLPDDWASWARAFRKRPLWEPAASTVSVSLGRGEIQRLIPHRAPFLLLDEVTALDVAQHAARARRSIDPHDPVFEGHFPGDPVYPGVLQIEMAGQLGVWLTQYLSGSDREGGVPIRAIKVHHAVFAAPVAPGDELVLHAQVLADDGSTAVVGGQVSVPSGIAAVAALEFYRLG